MPQLGRWFPSCEPATIQNLTVDFTPYLPAGRMLTSASCALSVEYTLTTATIDTTPGSRLSGLCGVTGGTSVQQEVAGLINGNNYLVTFTGTLDDGEVIVLWTTIACRAPH